MHDMKFLGVPSGGGTDVAVRDSSAAAGGEDNCEVAEEELLYYRTKWPWPLKDRDYTLARR